MSDRSREYGRGRGRKRREYNRHDQPTYSIDPSIQHTSTSYGPTQAHPHVLNPQEYRSSSTPSYGINSLADFLSRIDLDPFVQVGLRSVKKIISIELFGHALEILSAIQIFQIDPNSTFYRFLLL